jgi:cytochrome c oxidase subunit III
MANSLPLNQQQIELKRKSLSSSVAMTMIMVSFSMVFATLMLGYFSYRFTSDVWPPMGMKRVDLGLPTTSTVLILLSSLTYFLAEGAIAQDSLKKFKAYFSTTFVLSIVFMAVQSWLWFSLKKNGLFVDSGIFASMIYGFTWIHAAHVVGGIVALMCLVPTFLGKREASSSALWVKNVGIYWHFLGVVWVIMYFCLFVY